MRDQDAILILDQVDSGVIMLDEHLRVTFWNEFISRSSQIPFNSIKQKYWLDIFPMMEDTRIDKAIQKAVHFSFPSILSYKLLKDQFPLYKKSLATKPPYLIIQSIIIKPVLEDGINKGCIIYINDVSATAKREQDLNQQSKELREAIQNYKEVKNQFEQVFECAHNAIIIFSAKGQVINANPAAISIFPDRLTEFINTDIADILPELKNLHYSQEQEKYFFEEDCNIEFEQAVSTIGNKWLWVSVSPMTAGENNDEFFVFITDITQRKEVENRLVSANKELEEFTYRTSHDLRSPIVSSIGLMDIAKKGLENKEYGTVTTCVDHADKSLKKLETLIRDLLKLTESENREEGEQEIDFELMIYETFDSISQLEGFHKIEKKISLQHLTPLVAKKNRVTMILENLISNSVKYRDPSNDHPYIQIDTLRDNNNFVLEVTDNGLGIPEDQHSKLFKMFSRFHPKVAFGSGLGLYLMKKSAEALGGNIIYIHQAQGAKFRLTLPQKYCSN